jgi:hypothetical protein
MGVLTDIVVAHAAEAENVLRADVPSEAFDGIDANGIDHVKLGTLWELLSGKSDAVDEVVQMPLLAGDEEDGPWVFQIPPALVASLAALDDGAIESTASAWARTEEFLDWHPSDVVTVLRELCGAAQRATAQAKDLLMWNCL